MAKGKLNEKFSSNSHEFILSVHPHDCIGAKKVSTFLFFKFFMHLVLQFVYSHLFHLLLTFLLLMVAFFRGTNFITHFWVHCIGIYKCSLLDRKILDEET